ncbi:glycosyltransferase family 4 protein [Empedobacter falsenii]
MKVLWIVNILLPEIAEYLEKNKPVVGGWLTGLANALSQDKSIDLHIVTVLKGMKPNFVKIGNITYHTVDGAKESWIYLETLLRPDVVHIHGTEYNFGLNYIKSTNSQYKSVFSIQGLLSVSHRYYLAGISMKDVFLNLSFRDLVKFDNICFQQIKFKKKGEIEKSYFSECNFVIGRTSWDKSHSLALNPNINYFHCNEVLRNKFYISPKWKYSKCEKYSIFLSQASYPIKGLHVVIKAITFLIKEFPEIKVYVGGVNILNDRGFVNKIKQSGYSKYLNSLIKKNKLEKNIIFLGNLNESEIIEQYLRSNIFICPSSIENSPNSLAEAQILGVPSIASFVGGIPDMIDHEVNGLIYRFEEVEMLVLHIRKLFSDNHFCELMSFNSIKTAERRHNIAVTTREYLNVYSIILK